jgi:hypothetical protein
MEVKGEEGFIASNLLDLGQPDASAAVSPEKGPSVPIAQEDLWAPEMV